jgi:hypothetical protein
MFTASKHHPSGALSHFDSERIEALIRSFQATGDHKQLTEILTLTRECQFRCPSFTRPQLEGVWYEALPTASCFRLSQGQASRTL